MGRLIVDSNLPILGVVGGMGPSATALFYEMLIQECQEQLGAQRQSEYPHILIYNLPVIDIIDGQQLNDPEISQHIIETIRSGINTLSNAGATIIAIPCNTVHIFFDELVRGIEDVEILDIVNETVEEVLSRGHERVCLFATVSTIQSRLYQNQLEFRDIIVSTPNASESAHIAEIIGRVISGENERGRGQFAGDRRFLTRLTKKIAKKNRCNALILGCTDLSRLLSDRLQIATIDMLDSLKILAKASISRIAESKPVLSRPLTGVPR